MTCIHFFSITIRYVCTQCGHSRRRLPDKAASRHGCSFNRGLPHNWVTWQKWTCRRCGLTELRRPYTIPQDEVMGFLAPKVRRGRPKYTEEQRQEAQALYRKGGYTHKSLGKLLGISKSTIHKMVNGG